MVAIINGLNISLLLVGIDIPPAVILPVVGLKLRHASHTQPQVIRGRDCPVPPLHEFPDSIPALYRVMGVQIRVPAEWPDPFYQFWQSYLAVVTRIRLRSFKFLLHTRRTPGFLAVKANLVVCTCQDSRHSLVLPHIPGTQSHLLHP